MQSHGHTLNSGRVILYDMHKVSGFMAGACTAIAQGWGVSPDTQVFLNSRARRPRAVQLTPTRLRPRATVARGVMPAR
jgi:hypothetical protein